MLTIRTAAAAEFGRVRAFYRAAGYAGDVGPDDRVLVADAGNELVGVVRLAPENGITVLRGMRVSPAHQRAGIGTRLLAAVDQALGADVCYCIPYEHLLGFYGRIGFRDLDPAAAPPFLAARLEDYRARRPDRFRLMVRQSQGSAS